MATQRQPPAPSPARAPATHAAADADARHGTVRSVMKLVLKVFGLLHACMALLFALAAVLMVVVSSQVGWAAISDGFGPDSALGLMRAVGLLAAAVVALQIAQTIAEEEVVREAHISAPTRVRRFLSRFLVVVVVALAIEGLVATFKASAEEPAHLLYASSVFVATGVLLAGWGLFIRFNREAEELEPEAMAEAKEEDHKLQ